MDANYKDELFLVLLILFVGNIFCAENTIQNTQQPNKFEQMDVLKKELQKNRYHHEVVRNLGFSGSLLYSYGFWYSKKFFIKNNLIYRFLSNRFGLRVFWAMTGVCQFKLLNIKFLIDELNAQSQHHGFN